MKITEIQPQHERILIQLYEVKQKTEGGIELPDEVKDIPTLGKIFKMGPLAGKSLPEIKEGDDVMIMKFAGQEIEVGKTKFQLVMANDIIAKLKLEK